MGTRGCVNGTSENDCVRLSGRGLKKSSLTDKMILEALKDKQQQKTDGRDRKLADSNLQDVATAGGISRKFDRGFVPNKIEYGTDGKDTSDTATFTVDETSGGLTAVFLKDEFYLRCVLKIRVFYCMHGCI